MDIWDRIARPFDDPSSHNQVAGAYRAIAYGTGVALVLRAELLLLTAFVEKEVQVAAPAQWPLLAFPAAVSQWVWIVVGAALIVEAVGLVGHAGVAAVIRTVALLTLWSFFWPGTKATFWDPATPFVVGAQSGWTPWVLMFTPLACLARRRVAVA
jgi:hypothetical protein